MSLHRVASLETFMSVSEDGRRSRRGSDVSVGASERARKLTFNPLPESWDPVPAKDDVQNTSVGAFEVPKWKRILQLVVTVIYCLFSAGVVFGYAAIKPVLKTEGAYKDVCGDDDDTCIEVRLNLMFTVAAVATNVAALPIGAILDRYGPRVCGCLGALLLAVGSLVMAFAQDLPFDALLVGYLFLALGGPFIYISSFQLSNAFPRHSGLILALITGAFDASSALFLVYRLVFEGSGGAFGHREFFLAYLVVPVVIFAVQCTIMPAQSYKTVGEIIEDIEGHEQQHHPEASSTSRNHDDDEEDIDDQIDEETALLREERRAQREQRQHIAAQEIEELLGSAKADRQVRREEAKNEISGVWGVMHGRTVREQISSLWFWLICLFTVVQMTRINYFVATIRPQYQSLFGGDARRAAEVNTFFDAALPLGGIASIPFIGLVLDRLSTVTVLATLVSVATTIGALGCLPYGWAAYSNIVLFVLYRPFYYTAVSDYSAKVFGFQNFGLLYGTIVSSAGLFNFSQSALDYLFHVTFRGDPVPVNLMLLALGLLVGAALVVFVWWNVRKNRSKALARAAEYGDDF